MSWFKEPDVLEDLAESVHLTKKALLQAEEDLERAQHSRDFLRAKLRRLQKLESNGGDLLGDVDAPGNT